MKRSRDLDAGPIWMDEERATGLDGAGCVRNVGGGRGRRQRHRRRLAADSHVVLPLCAHPVSPQRVSSFLFFVIGLNERRAASEAEGQYLREAMTTMKGGGGYARVPGRGVLNRRAGAQRVYEARELALFVFWQ